MINKSITIELFPATMEFIYGNHTTQLIKYTTKAATLSCAKKEFRFKAPEDLLEAIVEDARIHLSQLVTQGAINKGCAHVTVWFNQRKLERISIWINGGNNALNWTLRFEAPEELTQRIINEIEVVDA